MKNLATTMYLFDLDGTLIASYMDNPNKEFATVALLPHVLEVWQYLRAKTRNNVAIVTNQAGVAFGYISKTDVERKFCTVGAALGYNWIEIHDGSEQAIMYDTGALNGAGVLPIYVCYNDSRSKQWQYQDATRRKPNGAMLKEAFEVGGSTYCVMIGDRLEDELAAKHANVDFYWAGNFFNEIIHHETIHSR